jgi:hypothetical protein
MPQQMQINATTHATTNANKCNNTCKQMQQQMQTTAELVVTNASNICRIKCCNICTSYFLGTDPSRVVHIHIDIHMDKDMFMF